MHQIDRNERRRPLGRRRALAGGLLAISALLTSLAPGVGALELFELSAQVDGLRDLERLLGPPSAGPRPVPGR